MRWFCVNLQETLERDNFVSISTIKHAKPITQIAIHQCWDLQGNISDNILKQPELFLSGLLTYFLFRECRTFKFSGPYLSFSLFLKFLYSFTFI